MSDYLISLIVPVYNKEKYLKKSIDSMVNQTYHNLEIILVNDGSTDNSGAICDMYEKANKNVKVIHQKNMGPSAAWKNGFGVSTGQYIAFADSDDWIDLDMIEKMSHHLTGIDKELVLCDHVLEYSDGTKKEVYQTLAPGEYNKEAIDNHIIFELIGHEHRHISLSRCMKLISRRLIEDNEGYCDNDILIGDDSTIIFPCIIDATRIYNMNHEPMYHYLYVNDSVVHRYDPKMFDNNRRLYQNYIKMLEAKFSTDNDKLERMLKAASAEYVFLLLLAIKNEARGNKKNSTEAIKRICEDTEVKKIVANAEINIADKSNALLYMVLRKPSLIRIELLKAAMRVYYLRSKG